MKTGKQAVEAKNAKGTWMLGRGGPLQAKDINCRNTMKEERQI